MSLGTEDLIRIRAYEIWESENRPAGRDKEHWDRAVREVALAPTIAPVKKVRKTAAKPEVVAPVVKVAAAKAAPAPAKIAPPAPAKAAAKPKPKR